MTHYDQLLSLQYAIIAFQDMPPVSPNASYLLLYLFQILRLLYSGLVAELTLRHRTDQVVIKYPQGYFWPVYDRHPVLAPCCIDQLLREAFPVCAGYLPGQNVPECCQATALTPSDNSAGLLAIAR